MKKVNLLSRAEMKKVMGGNAPAGGTELQCTTPGGTENWRRLCNAHDALSQCEAIYPAHIGHIQAACAIIIEPEP